MDPPANPSLVVEHQQTLQGFDERETVVGAEIPFSVSGRRGVAREAAAVRRRAAYLRAGAELTESALEFRSAYVTAVFERERLVVLEEQQRALAELQSALTALAARGESAAYDVRRHQVEAELHARRLLSARARAVMGERLVAGWLGRPVTPQELGTAGLSLAAIPKANRSSPRVAALRTEARAAALDAESARRRWIPDPEIFAGYRQIAAEGDTGHGFSVGLKIPLTFFDHGQASQVRAQAESAALDARAERIERQRSAAFGAVTVRLELAREAAEQAAQTLHNVQDLREGARKLYGSGELSIAELLDAYRATEGAALARIDTAEELALARLEAMRIAGAQFEPELEAACGSQGSGR